MQLSDADQPPRFRIDVIKEGWRVCILASMLQAPSGLPVVDQTGPAGAYDIKLEFASDLEQDSSVFAAPPREPGTRSPVRKGSSPFLQLDHIDKVPTEH
jgi:uncharacterized protein (TIGR03435 family)